MPLRLLAAFTLAVLVLSGCSRDPGFVDLDDIAPPTVPDDHTPPAPQVAAPDPAEAKSHRAFLKAWCTDVAGRAAAQDVPVLTLDAAARAHAAVAAPVPDGLELEHRDVSATLTRLTDATSQSSDKRVVETITTELDQQLTALLRPLGEMRGKVKPCVAMDTATLRDLADLVYRRLHTLAAASSDVDDGAWLRANVPVAAERDLPAGIAATVTDAAKVQLTVTVTGTAVCVDVHPDRTATVTDGACG